MNLITAYDSTENRYYRLTRSYYYRASGFKELIKKENEWNLELKEVYEKMSKTPTNTIEDKNWENYQKILVEHYKELWELNTREERRKRHFRVKRLKEKCLDLFFNQFEIKGKPKPVIAYGGASMNPTGKGELSVPVKYVYKKCKERFLTVKVDEKYTTIMHHKCKKMTTAVKVRSEYTRGLRWCSTCSELVSRDKNACHNIEKVYEEEKKNTRPTYLSDTYERTRTRIKELKEVESFTMTKNNRGKPQDQKRWNRKAKEGQK